MRTLVAQIGASLPGAEEVLGPLVSEHVQKKKEETCWTGGHAARRRKTALERREQRARSAARFAARVAGLVCSLSHRGSAATLLFGGLAAARHAPRSSQVPETRWQASPQGGSSGGGSGDGGAHAEHLPGGGSGDGSSDGGAKQSSEVPQEVPSAQFAAGTPVKLQGLVQRSGLGGRHGVVLPGAQERGRVPVRLQPMKLGGVEFMAKEEVHAKPANLVRLSSEEANLFRGGG